MPQLERDSIANTLLVAIAVCLVCSILVSGAAVALKPAQQRNKELDRRQNILVAAGMLEPGASRGPQGRTVEELFAQFEARVVDLRSGELTDAVDPESYDQLRAAKREPTSRPLSEAEDKATISRREHYGLVYIMRDAQGAIEKLVIPIRGYGLWGTLYGYLALNGDLETAAGLGFYQHQETPGLGGEVDNSRWKADWPGTELFDEQGEPAVRLVADKAPPSDPAREHQIDKLSGATLTSRGVENLVNFWLGELGYGPFLETLREGKA